MTKPPVTTPPVTKVPETKPPTQSSVTVQPVIVKPVAAPSIHPVRTAVPTKFVSLTQLPTTVSPTFLPSKEPVVRRSLAPITRAPLALTDPPVTQTDAPVTLTEAPVPLTKAPLPRTKAPVSRTKAPVSPTKAPVVYTFAPLQDTHTSRPSSFEPVIQPPTPSTTVLTPTTIVSIPTTTLPMPTTTVPTTTISVPTTTVSIPTATDPIPTTDSPVTVTFAPVLAPDSTLAKTVSPARTVEGLTGTDQRPNGTSTGNLSGGAWAGIASAGAVLLVAFYVFSRPRTSAFEEHKDSLVPIGDESIFTEDSGKGRFVVGNDHMVDNHSMKGISIGSGSSHGSNHGSETSSFKDMKEEQMLVVSKNVGQVDPSTAASIALLRRDDVEQSSGSSSSICTPRVDSPFISRPPFTLPPGIDAETFKRRKLEDLDIAIQAADWNGVYRIASSIAGNEELSSMSGLSISARHSAPVIPSDIESQPNDAESLMSRISQENARVDLEAGEDEVRAAKLDQLVECGDWTGLATTAAGFAEADGSFGVFSPQKRSLLGLISGRRTSAAAEAAINSASSVDSSFVESASGRVGAAPMEMGQDETSYAFVTILGRGRTNTDETASESSGESPKKSSKVTGSSGDTLLISQNAISAGMATVPVPVPDSASEIVPLEAMAGLSAAVVASTAAFAEASWSITSEPPRTPSERHSGQKKETIRRGWKKLFRRGKSTGYSHIDDSSISTDDPIERSLIFKTKSEDGNFDDAMGRRVASLPSASSYQSRQNQGEASFDGSHVSYLSLRTDLDRAVIRGDWGAVESFSTQIEAADPTPRKLYTFNEEVDITLGAMSRTAAVISHSNSISDSSVVSLRTELDQAVDRGDWALVEELSNQILGTSTTKVLGNHSSPSKYMILSEDQKVPSSTPIKVQHGIFRAPTSPVSHEGSSSSCSTPDRSKVDTIGKMVSMRNWRGVAALAGVYDLEESGSLPSSPRHFATNAPHPDPTLQGFANDWIAMVDSLDNNDKENSFLSTERVVRESTNTSSGNQFSIMAMMENQPRTVSPNPSFSSVSTENNTLQEFARLVGEGDWSGLVDAATREEGIATSDLAEVGLQFKASGMFHHLPTQNELTNSPEGVYLRPTDIAHHKEFTRIDNKESFHGVRMLIPYWEEVTPKKGDQETSGDHQA